MAKKKKTLRDKQAADQRMIAVQTPLVTNSLSLDNFTKNTQQKPSSGTSSLLSSSSYAYVTTDIQRTVQITFAILVFQFILYFFMK